MTPLITTAIAAHNAIWLKRGNEILRSSWLSNAIAITPPTQKESAMTWMSKDPIASACEPLEAAWL